jgi:ABC-2 type transport system ATP-binding protein
VNPGVSGRDSLAVLATTVGIGRRRVDETLALVGLSERADDPVRGYSLGMRQRLGIAIALLKDPELLILDEPANGLDPAGIREVRELVRQLGGEGRTVFLSSHLLGEVEQVCDEVAIVSAGRTIAHGAVSEVLARARPAALWVTVRDLDGATDALRRASMPAERDGDRIRVGIVADEAESVTRALVAAGHFPSELRPVETTLEDAFFALTAASREER